MREIDVDCSADVWLSRRRLHRHAFDAERGLPEGIERWAQSLGDGRVHSSSTFGLRLALRRARAGAAARRPKLAPFTLARLRRLLTQVADEALVVVDATLAAGSAGEPLDVVRAMGMALSGRESHVSSLIAVRPQPSRSKPGPPPFTGLVQMILDTQSGSQSALTPESLFRAMQRRGDGADIPAAG